MTSALASRLSVSSSTFAEQAEPADDALTDTLQLALEEVWQACLQLPSDPSSFEALSPEQRRKAHDLGVRVQDRLLLSLSLLVEGMATDGVELVGDDGVPVALAQGPASRVSGQD